MSSARTPGRLWLIHPCRAFHGASLSRFDATHGRVEQSSGLAPVNSSPSFTGNGGSFAEYRVSACGIALKIPPLKEP